MPRLAAILTVAAASLAASPSHAAIVTFFTGSQTLDAITHATTSDTITSDGYMLTYSQDKLFTGGVGMNGRNNLISFPDGLHCQSISSGPNTGGGYLTIRRVDGATFGLLSFTAKLMSNTWGAGASFEVMPKLNGEDGYNDPVFFDGTGIGGFSTFTYSNLDQLPLTPLAGFESYKISIIADWELLGLTLQDASPEILPPDPPVDAPEPTTLALAAFALPALFLRRRVRS